MIRAALFALFLLSLTTMSFAEGPSAKAAVGSSPTKSQSPSTQIYEKENTQRTVTVEIRNLIETEDGWAAYFDKPAGGYSFKDPNIYSILLEAKQKKKKISVKIDDESKNVLKAIPPAGSGEGT